MKVLILCTGNSCRSQMAEGILKSFDERLKVYSAGTNPSKEVNPYAIKVLDEIDINIKNSKTKSIDLFINDSFDFLITVCDKAKETCPTFFGKVEKKLHIGFRDPAEATGNEEEILKEFRIVRDEIIAQFYPFYVNEIVLEEQRQKALEEMLKKKKNDMLSQCNPTNENSCSGCTSCNDLN